MSTSVLETVTECTQPLLHRCKANLTAHECDQIVQALITRLKGDELHKGANAEVAALIGVHPNTVRRVWKHAEEEWHRTGVYRAIHRMHLKGRKRPNRSQQLDLLRSVPVVRHSTFRAADDGCSLPTTTVLRELQRGHLRSQNSVIHPLLAEDNKRGRLEFCKVHIDPDTMHFLGMYNTIHVDEKIFYITQPRRRLLLLPDEQAPTRRIRSRRFITRVMMLAAVSRPRYGPDGELFDGKLGIWAFTEQVAAVRSSKRRPAGTRDEGGVRYQDDLQREADF